MYHSLDKRISFAINFLPDKEFLSKLEISRIELPELTPSILMENCDHCITLFDQFYFQMP